MKLSFFTTVLLAVTAANAALDAKIKAKGRRYYGNILDRNTINDGTVTNILNTEFGAITAENSMKWDATEPSRGNFQWDVVNEVFEDNGQWRNSVFYRVLGEEFVDIAFRAARAADPNAKLYINDYNLDYAGPKIDATLALVGRLRQRGVPIDGIGTQAHLIVGRIGNFEAQLKRLGDTGLDVAITELDIRIPRPVDQGKLQQQQRDYEAVTRACLNVPQCVGITIWGVSDRHTWVDGTFPGDDAPLLWDDNYNRKIAYNGVDAALN